ncbi:hypothetical protein OIE91_11385 [Streptomyces albidoflavus]|uniref:hypothetical protein n=1 Tax=Streptomyces albidoflavus TaxID=1886 RepID=UPI00352CA96F
MKLKPNRIMAEPATVEACRQDRGTAAERAARAEDVTAQQENTRWHAKAAAEAPKGRGSR